MQSYLFEFESADGQKTEGRLFCEELTDAVNYALPLARGGTISILQDGKLLATIDDRSCTRVDAKSLLFECIPI